MDFFSMYVLYSTLLPLLSFRFHRVGECWDRTQDKNLYDLTRSGATKSVRNGDRPPAPYPLPPPPLYSGPAPGCAATAVIPPHRVGRVESFSPVVGIGTPPTPHPLASVLPILCFRGGGANSLAREEMGESQFRRGVLPGAPSPWEVDLARQVLSSHNVQIQIFPQYKIVLKDIFQDCFEADLCSIS